MSCKRQRQKKICWKKDTEAALKTVDYSSEDKYRTEHIHMQYNCKDVTISFPDVYNHNKTSMLCVPQPQTELWEITCVMVDKLKLA